ncbi:B-cell antigen receptor complex-associated protein alpha chain [Acipenser oxyrinchus oxyrinchus]|uniref:B-cell antigen receptor complex-associated protein alpha chain n=1 Tax=Acipenser oxyrinchus oxyrinchus TaxID=40147 RepID=A0AAD8CIW2_ACIOX|nr:B-cell antigen receptor complex-associated protein alpha chain [Acipenser oxyrinchus oxyrinchus]KAK1155135.1 B-cell antigen receptor complex-associated protein alpha chain [Acipenser oxyrinchus oxyrinchus]
MTRGLLYLIAVFTAGLAKTAVEFTGEPHSLTAILGETITMTCSVHPKVKSTALRWVKLWKPAGNCTETTNVTGSDIVTISNNETAGTLKMRALKRNDSGLYQCVLTEGADQQFSHGTYLRVIRPAPPKLLNMSEGAKNKLITAQGIILLLCVLLPGTVMLYQTKQRNMRNYEMKYNKEEEENIYEGLNPEDFSLYHDLTHTTVRNPYQDVGSVGSMRSYDTQLEKP